MGTTTLSDSGASNLTQLARQEGVSLASLLRANPQLSNPNVVGTGARIKIPSKYENESQSRESQARQLSRVFEAPLASGASAAIDRPGGVSFNVGGTTPTTTVATTSGVNAQDYLSGQYAAMGSYYQRQATQAQVAAGVSPGGRQLSSTTVGYQGFRPEPGQMPATQMTPEQRRVAAAGGTPQRVIAAGNQPLPAVESNIFRAAQIGQLSWPQALGIGAVSTLFPPLAGVTTALMARQQAGAPGVFGRATQAHARQFPGQAGYVASPTTAPVSTAAVGGTTARVLAEENSQIANNISSYTDAAYRAALGALASGERPSAEGVDMQTLEALSREHNRPMVLLGDGINYEQLDALAAQIAQQTGMTGLTGQELLLTAGYKQTADGNWVASNVLGIPGGGGGAGGGGYYGFRYPSYGSGGGGGGGSRGYASEGSPLVNWRVRFSA